MSPGASKPFIFVLMPFKSEFDDVYKLGIKVACKKAGAYCERVDEQEFEGSIVDRIFNQINKSDIVVADMTGQNPNVFFEAGYAFALEKRVILLTQSASDIPFDLKVYPHLIYGSSINNLQIDLAKKIRHYVKHPDSKPVTTPESLEYYLGGQRLREGIVVTVEMPPRLIVGVPGVSIPSVFTRDSYPLSLAVKNAAKEPIEIAGYQFALVFPSSLADTSQNVREFAVLPDNQAMFITRPMYSEIFPGGWHTEVINISCVPAELRRQTLPCELQVMYPFGAWKLRFFISVNDAPN